MKVILCLLGCTLLWCSAVGAQTHIDGQKWKWLGPAGGNIRDLLADRNHPNVWYVINGSTLYRSEDFAQSWDVTSLTHAAEVAIQPVSSKVFVLNSKHYNDPELWTSTDVGHSFQLVTNLNFPLRRVIPHPQHPNVLYGLGLSDWDLAVSYNGGHSWMNFTNLPFRPGDSYNKDYVVGEYEFSDLLVSPLDPETIYATGELFLYLKDCHIECSDSVPISFLSRDLGRSWSVSRRQTPRMFAIDSSFPNRAFGFESHTFFRLSGGWKVISRVPSDLWIQELISVPGSPRELLALATDFSKDIAAVNLLQSMDEGGTWKRLPVPLGGSVSALLVMADGRLLAGTEGAGMYKTDDHQRWHPSNAGFHESAAAQILSVAGTSVLYTRSPYSFLFRSLDGGRYWSNLTFKLPAFLPSSDRIYSISSIHTIPTT